MKRLKTYIVPYPNIEKAELDLRLYESAEGIDKALIYQHDNIESVRQVSQEFDLELCLDGVFLIVRGDTEEMYKFFTKNIIGNLFN